MPDAFFRWRLNNASLTYKPKIPYYTLIMSRHRLRIVSFITLITAFTVLSGIVSTASALLASADVNICCDLDTRQDNEENFPCATPDCVCTFCVTAMILSDIPAIKTISAPAICHANLPQRYHLKEPPSTIDYPPETH